MQIVLIILLIVVIFIYIKFKKNQKVLSIGSIALITGGVKSGKSSLGVHATHREYYKAYRKWFFKSLFNTKKVKYEKPLYYSNIPVYIPPTIWHILKHDYVKNNGVKCVPYAPLTNDILDRKKRINFGSMTYCGEFSLIADSMSGSVKGNKEEQEKIYELAERLTLFVKLYGHMTGGQYYDEETGITWKSIGPGKCICDTQALADVHFGLRRNISTAIYIEKSIKWIPFIMLFKLRQLIYIDENSVNVFDSDISDSMKWYICKKPFKYFDYCCYSLFTDNLEKDNNTIAIGPKDSKKVKIMPTFRKFRSLKINEKNEVIVNEK